MSKKHTTTKKKAYIAPAIEVIELEPSFMIANTGMNTGGSLDGTENGGDHWQGGGDADANRHRGEWGNLWK